ncbi:hypothetical protein SLS62_002816 [Diatrype stigma]|uniref:Uncharacterized protein n=1 Tax=Diatrype stigma TaxID=117547 RepID=A0AAN9V681_9PEZI
MHHEDPSPDQQPLARRLSDQLPALESEHIEPQHTRGRPPHLMTSNFSPADMNGPVAEPQSMHSSHSRTFTSSDSGNTDSTAIEGTPAPPIRPHLYGILSWDYVHNWGTAMPLTEPALRAHDCESSARPYPGNLAAWVKNGQTPFRGGEPSLDISSSMIMANDHPRTAATTHGTLSSRDVVPAPTTQSDRTAEFVVDAGGQFADSSDSYHLYGPDLIIQD